MQAKTTKAQGHRTAHKLAMGAAMAAALATCVAVPGFALARDGAMSTSVDTRAQKKADKQILAAERAVAKQPRSVEARTQLAHTYLAAGRFTSASTSFEDAVSLGDQSPATALAMALAYIGTSRNGEAVALLGQWRETIPASDYALAIALAGQPAQATAILSDAIKQGDNTVKSRQNLAYALALDGHLQESRMIAAQDVPAERLDARLSEWTLQATVGSQQSRVAALLGAPMRGDAGQPAQLALGDANGSVAMAVNGDEPAPALAANGELPAIDAQPALAQAEAPVPAPSQPATQLASFDAVEAPLMVESASVSAPVTRQAMLQEAPPMRSVRNEPASTPSRKPKMAAAKAIASRRTGSHVVQLGSFASEEGARKAWNIFVRRDASLKGRELRITQAMVNGRRFWRVAAAGYDAGAARAKCSSVRGQGKQCLAYAGAVGALRKRVQMALSERP